MYTIYWLFSTLRRHAFLSIGLPVLNTLYCSYILLSLWDWFQLFCDKAVQSIAIRKMICIGIVQTVLSPQLTESKRKWVIKNKQNSTYTESVGFSNKLCLRQTLNEIYIHASVLSIKCSLQSLLVKCFLRADPYKTIRRLWLGWNSKMNPLLV